VHDLRERETLSEIVANLRTELTQKTEEVEEVTREFDEFLRSASHDLRSPLHGIRGWCEALEEDCAETLDDSAKRDLQELKGQIGNLGRLLEGLLRLARMARSTMARETVDLGAIAREVWLSLQVADPTRAIAFTTRGELAVLGDPVLLHVVVQNLLENAWKFTRPTHSARVEFGSTDKEGRRVFYVRDNGVGFPAEEKHRLFQPFRRLHRTNDFPGTGLGLAAVRKAVLRHGGRVWCESSEGHGATFFFSL
jgi:signal transduction histidine kinase